MFKAVLSPTDQFSPTVMSLGPTVVAAVWDAAGLAVREGYSEAEILDFTLHLFELRAGFRCVLTAPVRQFADDLRALAPPTKASRDELTLALRKEAA